MVRKVLAIIVIVLLMPIQVLAGETAVNTRVYNANNSFIFSTEIVEEKDKSAARVRDYLTVTHNFFKQLFGRNSLDNKGSTMTATINYGMGLNGSFWDGEQAVFGEGDTINYGDFSEDLDIVAHEMVHGLIQYTANLKYEGQSGALNESIADVFGVLIKTYNKYNVRKGGTWKFDSKDWVVGENIYTPSIEGDALRSLANPRLYGQPENMSEYAVKAEDNGGVHINSGIMNKAAFLIAQNIGCEKTARIYYRALTKYFGSETDFKWAGKGLIKAAEELYGVRCKEAKVIEEAVIKVGIR